MNNHQRARFGLLCVFIILAGGCLASPVASPQSASPPAITQRTTAPSPESTLTTRPTVHAGWAPPEVATLPSAVARATLLNLLAENADCELPCFWGIRPGEQDIDSALGVLLPLQGVSELTSCLPGVCMIVPVLSDGEQLLHTSASLVFGDDGRVLGMEVILRQLYSVAAAERYGRLEVYSSESFARRVARYSLPHVLSTVGSPPTIMISTTSEAPVGSDTSGFDILLMYPDNGLLVNYTTRGRREGDYVVGCPSPADGHIELELSQPGKANALASWLQETDWPAKLGRFKPLEEVASITIEEFAVAFRSGAGKCIATQAALWPEP